MSSNLGRIRFVTDDIEQIYKRLESAGKSEFETGAAYKKSLTEEAQQTPPDFLVEPMSTTYNADTERMVLALSLKRTRRGRHL